MDNLSGWSIHCRSFFEKEFPILFRSIKKFLPVYRKMRKKYGWGDNSIEKLFLESDFKDVKINLKILPKRDRELILKILDVLDKQLKSQWVERKKLLEHLIETLAKYWKKYSQKAIKEIEELLDLKLPEQIEIYILFTPRGTGGGVNISETGITLEIGDSHIPLIISFELLLHELIHFTEIVNHKETEKELKKLGLSEKGEISETLLVKEAIVNLLCPHGVLSKTLKIGKFFIRKKPRDRYEKELINYQRLLKNLLIDYFKNKKDQNYWNDFLPKIADFIKKKRKDN